MSDLNSGAIRAIAIDALLALEAYEASIDRLVDLGVETCPYEDAADAFEDLRARVGCIDGLSGSWIGLLIGRFEVVALLWKSQAGEDVRHRLTLVYDDHKAAIAGLRKRAVRLLLGD
jgi:hypothetical protein